jgi:hypothetical protein
MSTVSSTENRLIFLVSPSRLAWGEYVGDRKIGEGDMSASYSADRIAENKPIRQPFTWQGSLWSCVSMSGRGLTITREHELTAYRLIPLALFSGEATTYTARAACYEPAETMRDHPLGSYHGVIVKHGKNSFVLSGPPGIFMAGDDPKGTDDQTSAAVQLGLF